MTGSRAGRPRVGSRRMIEEAAAELFLEHGYGAVRVEDIARVAGVSRASFFNYFASKADVLWVGADEALEEIERALDAGLGLAAALQSAIEHTDPSLVPLALSQSETMEAREELTASGGLRLRRLHAAVRRGVADPVDASVITAALATAWAQWAGRAAARRPLADLVDAALERVGRGIRIE